MNIKASPDPLSDEILIARVARGDRNAFESLYDRHAPAVLGILIRIVEERVAAEDLLQESFWQVWQKAPAYSSHNGSFASWLFRIAHILAISVHGQGKVRLGEMIENPQSGSDGRQAPNMVENLTPDQRQILAMAYFHGMTRHQIANATGATLDTIQALAQLGLEKLKEGLKTGEDEV